MQDYLELDVRKKIYECISKYPGLHFREIQRRTGLATGSLDYHIHFLHKHGMIKLEKDARFVRYYVSAINLPEEKELLSLLRQSHARHILIFLIQKKNPPATMIAEYVGISPSNLSWYMRTLQEKNIVEQRKKGRFRFYKIKNKELKESIIKCLIAYRASFLDEIVDNFTDAWVSE